MKPRMRGFRTTGLRDATELDVRTRDMAPCRAMDVAESRRTQVLRGAATWLPVWCFVYLFLHAYEHDAVRAGRDAALTRLAQTAYFELELLLVVLPLGAAALVARHRPRGLGVPGLRLTEQVSGGVALVLLAVHLWQVWLPRRAARAPSAAYAGMLEATHGVTGTALVLLFVTAAVLHLGLAVVPAFCHLLVRPMHAYVLSAALSTGLWLWWVDLLSAYAAAAPLL